MPTEMILEMEKNPEAWQIGGKEETLEHEKSYIIPELPYRGNWQH